uniref:Uncharacterized protein n=1 Tax=Rhizophora mucronata TaxID=61149 RepID=A0A2P2LMW9_RHIMU
MMCAGPLHFLNSHPCMIRTSRFINSEACQPYHSRKTDTQHNSEHLGPYVVLEDGRCILFFWLLEACHVASLLLGTVLKCRLVHFVIQCIYCFSLGIVDM